MFASVADSFASTKTCISRITDDAYTQKFGNGRNNFYIELRCHGTCIRGLDVCLRCVEKSDTCKNQASRKFPHGNVNEPIPDKSHIFGGKWYEEHVRKYGTPSEDVLQFAIEHQRKARDGFPPLPPVVVETAVAVAPSKKILRVTRATKEEVEQWNREEEEKKESSSNEKPKRRIVRRSATVKEATTTNPYRSFVESHPPMIHQEVTVPSHLETTLEQFDAEGFRIEYVKLEPFVFQGITYYRDASKQKLYEHNARAIGNYVGRYDREREEIRTDIPDSDDET